MELKPRLVGKKNPTLFVASNGAQIWSLNDEYHREDGPACIWPNGDQEWCLHGKAHREDGPAYIRHDGATFWMWEDDFHRIDGPAVEKPDGTKEWWINGVQYDHLTWMIKTYEIQQRRNDVLPIL